MLLGVTLQPWQGTRKNSHLVYGTAARLGWCVAGLTAGACNPLLSSLLLCMPVGWCRSHLWVAVPVWGGPALSQGVARLIHHPDDAPTRFQPLHSFGMKQPQLWAAGMHCGLMASGAWMRYLREKPVSSSPVARQWLLWCKKHTAKEKRSLFLVWRGQTGFQTSTKGCQCSYLHVEKISQLLAVLKSQNLLPPPFVILNNFQEIVPS